MSRCLTERAMPHVVLERGEVANSWKTERWSSLRLLTPNWQSRLPGHAYAGPDPDGFMSMPQVVRMLEDYAAASRAPVIEGTRVTSVSADGDRYRVETTRGSWSAGHVVIASGACNLASVPGFAAALPSEIAQLTPLDYRGPEQIAPGGVLVVGGSATGVQLAAELRRAGRDVVLSTGEHIRMPRHYRGRDIQWWMEASGIHATPLSQVDDIDRARRLPSLQLTGQGDVQFTDLNALQAQGIEIAGRLAGVRDGTALFSGALANHCALSDLKMNRLLDTLDAWAETAGLPDLPAPEHFAPTAVAAAPRLTLDLAAGRISTVLWATGFRPDHAWLHLPVFDRRNRLTHDQGTVAPGLHVLGLPFLRRRNSALIDGVGEDARHLADLIDRNTGHRAAPRKGPIMTTHTKDDHIRAGQAKVIERMTADPAACLTTLTAVGHIGEGLSCRVEQGRFSAVTDMGTAMGGDMAGPPPGFFARAAIVGCVGIGVKMMAVREGLVFDRMTVTVETDFDDSALMGLGDNSAAPLRTRVRIDVESAEDQVRIHDLVDRALDRDPWFLALRDAQVVEPLVFVSEPSAARAVA